MKPLTQYGRMAEQHWRQFLPNMVAKLEAKGQLRLMLLEHFEKDTQLEASQYGLIFMLFGILLSGFMYPLTAMPPALRPTVCTSLGSS